VPKDVNYSTEPVRGAKSFPIFISKISDKSLPPLRQLLNQITNGELDLKNINADNYKIQTKNSIAYTNIVKEVKIRNTEFHTYKPKHERSFNVILKHMPSQEKIDAIKRVIEEFEHKVTNIRNIKKRGAKVPLNMFYIEPENYKKDI